MDLNLPENIDRSIPGHITSGPNAAAVSAAAVPAPWVAAADAHTRLTSGTDPLQRLESAHREPTAKATSSKVWYGFDLDRTLALYSRWLGVDHIGDPVPAMLAKVKQYLAEGKTCKIFTARVWYDHSVVITPINGKYWSSISSDPYAHSADKRFVEAMRSRAIIQEWCLQHVGVVLDVTCEKDPWCLEIWDDIAREVEPNTGRTAHDMLDGILRVEVSNEAYRQPNPNGRYPVCKPAVSTMTCERCKEPIASVAQFRGPCPAVPRDERWGENWAQPATV